MFLNIPILSYNKKTEPIIWMITWGSFFPIFKHTQTEVSSYQIINCCWYIYIYIITKYYIYKKHIYIYTRPLYYLYIYIYIYSNYIYMCVCTYIYIFSLFQSEYPCLMLLPRSDALQSKRLAVRGRTQKRLAATAASREPAKRMLQHVSTSMVLWTTSIRFIWHNRKATLCFKFITKMKLAIWITWDSLWSTISCTEWQLRNYKEQTGTDSQQILTKWKAQPLEHQKQHISQCFLVSLICKHKQNMH